MDDVISTAHFTELRAADDQLDGGADVVIAGFELGEHGSNQRLVGELHAASEGVADQLAAELTEEIIAAVLEQVTAQAVETIDTGAVWQNDLRIGFASASDGVEAFKGKAEGIDAAVAASAVGIGAVLLDELAFGETFGRLLGENGHAFGWNGQLLAEHDLAEPRTAQDAAGARGTGLLRECGSEAQDAAATLRADVIHTMPI